MFMKSMHTTICMQRINAISFFIGEIFFNQNKQHIHNLRPYSILVAKRDKYFNLKVLHGRSVMLQYILQKCYDSSPIQTNKLKNRYMYFQDGFNQSDVILAYCLMSFKVMVNEYIHHLMFICKTFFLQCHSPLKESFINTLQTDVFCCQTCQKQLISNIEKK